MGIIELWMRINVAQYLIRSMPTFRFVKQNLWQKCCWVIGPTFTYHQYISLAVFLLKSPIHFWSFASRDWQWVRGVRRC